MPCIYVIMHSVLISMPVNINSWFKRIQMTGRYRSSPVVTDYITFVTFVDSVGPVKSGSDRSGLITASLARMAQ
jgi:hypothetical protein